MKKRHADIYAGLRPEDVPAYTVSEAARYVGTPVATLRSWFFGQVGFRQVLEPQEKSTRALSFRNLVEAHVLSSLRVAHSVPLPAIRKAIRSLQDETGSRHPLVELPLRVGGRQLFLETVSGLVNLEEPGQIVLSEIMDAYLRRVEHEGTHLARLFPFTRKREMESPERLASQPKFVVITPKIGFGRPVLAGTNIRTSIIAERYLAGESIADLAADYERSPLEVEEAIRSEYPAAA